MDKFFYWFNENFPEINKISIRERNNLLDIFRNEIGEEGYTFDKKYSIEYFNNNIPHQVQSKKVSIRGKTKQGYFIGKKIPQDSLGYFATDKYETDNMSWAIPEADILTSKGL